MTIVDSRFGGEIVTAKGKLYKFDSIDCLIDYLRKNPEGKKEVFVSDFQLPGTLLKADDAQFIINQNHSAPMGSRFISVNPQSAEANQTLEGPKLKWSEVLSPQ